MAAPHGLQVPENSGQQHNSKAEGAVSPCICATGMLCKDAHWQVLLCLLQPAGLPCDSTLSRKRALCHDGEGTLCFGPGPPADKAHRMSSSWNIRCNPLLVTAAEDGRHSTLKLGELMLGLSTVSCEGLPCDESPSCLLPGGASPSEAKASP